VILWNGIDLLSEVTFLNSSIVFVLYANVVSIPIIGIPKLLEGWFAACHGATYMWRVEGRVVQTQGKMKELDSWVEAE
jgi:hypothetical protein